MISKEDSPKHIEPLKFKEVWKDEGLFLELVKLKTHLYYGIVLQRPCIWHFTNLGLNKIYAVFDDNFG
jgi:hypothetical protein